MTISRVWDSFMFAGETDMLWFRLSQLDGKVAGHVITEATQTHRGVEREPWLMEHLDCCLAPVRDKLHIVTLSFPPSVTRPWDREHYQRDLLWQGFQGVAGDVRPDDYILVSDVDEIPSDEVLAAEYPPGPSGPPAYALRQRIFHSAVDWEYPEPQLTSVLVRAGNISWPTSTLSVVRDHRYGLPVIEDAGWHFSWVGTQVERVVKLDTRTCHTEMPEGEALAIRTNATWDAGEHAAPDSQVKAVDVDDTWPEYIRQRRCPDHWFRPRR